MAARCWGNDFCCWIYVSPCFHSPSGAIGVPAVLQRHRWLPGVGHLHLHHLRIPRPRGHMAQVPPPLLWYPSVRRLARRGGRMPGVGFETGGFMAKPWTLISCCILSSKRDFHKVLEPGGCRDWWSTSKAPELILPGWRRTFSKFILKDPAGNIWTRSVGVKRVQKHMFLVR